MEKFLNQKMVSQDDPSLRNLIQISPQRKSKCYSQILNLELKKTAISYSTQAMTKVP